MPARDPSYLPRPPGSNTPSEKAIRDWYQDVGVDAYYLQHGEHYVNPHLPWIQELLMRHHARLDLAHCLDLCCGHGEVSEILQQLGYSNIQGCDPYTHATYEERLERPCFSWSFEDLLQGKLTEHYSSIISSFALHLCPLDQLVPLVWQLLRCTNQLVILTPHKRPVLEAIPGIKLEFEDSTSTDRNKRVRLKIYGPDH